MAQNDGLGTMLALYRAVWRVTGRQQVLLIALSLVIAALAAVKAGLLAAGSPPYGGWPRQRRRASACCGCRPASRPLSITAHR